MTKQLKTDFKIFQDGIPTTVSYTEIVDYYQKNGQSTNDIDPSQYPMVVEFTFGDIFIQSTHALKGKNEVFRYVYLGQINYDEAGNVLPSSLERGAVIFSELSKNASNGYSVLSSNPVAFASTSSFLSVDRAIQNLFDSDNIDHEFEIRDNKLNVISGNGQEGIMSNGFGSFYPENWDIKAMSLDNSTELSDSIGRLYTAAFGRTAEEEGLNYWVEAAADNLISYEDIAYTFTISDEFITRFGPNVSNQIFISNLYKNVLGRSPDEQGLTFWENAFNTNQINQTSMLIEFANSAENITISGQNG